jgi:SAM-dependent methyltransferase
MAKIDPYEERPDTYDAWFSRNRFAYESELQAVRLLLPPEGMGVEIGVGTGRFAGELGIPLGVEPSKSMRKMARERGIAVIGGIAEALPFRDGRFDFVLMVTTLCFFDDVEGSLREAHRVLTPTGSLVIGFIDRSSPLGRTYEERKGESLFYRDATFHSALEITAFLKNAGFRALTFHQTIFQDPVRMEDIEPVREGYGEGCFVVVKAGK